MFYSPREAAILLKVRQEWLIEHLVAHNLGVFPENKTGDAWRMVSDDQLYAWFADEKLMAHLRRRKLTAVRKPRTGPRTRIVTKPYKKQDLSTRKKYTGPHKGRQRQPAKRNKILGNPWGLLLEKEGIPSTPTSERKSKPAVYSQETSSPPLAKLIESSADPKATPGGPSAASTTKPAPATSPSANAPKPPSRPVQSYRSPRPS